MRSTDGILQDSFQQRTAGTQQRSDASDLCPLARGLGTMQMRMLISVHHNGNFWLRAHTIG
jgi:hypothetical protein